MRPKLPSKLWRSGSERCPARGSRYAYRAVERLWQPVVGMFRVHWS